VPTTTLISALVTAYPNEWGLGSPFGKALTAQRLGRMLARSYGVNSERPERVGPRGYVWSTLLPVWRRMGIVTPDPPRSAPVFETGASGARGATGPAVSRETVA
jgi:hypothetical protein